MGTFLGLLRNKILALALLMPCSAIAAPMLSGNLIQTINTDKAYYPTGSTAQVYVKLVNTTGSPFSGLIQANVTGRGVSVGSTVTSQVTNLPVGATQYVPLSVPLTNSGSYRGYLVDITATNNNQVIDEQTTALDQSPDWWTFPRQCWVTATWTGWPYHNPEVTTSPEKNISGLNAWHCNNLQFFNMLYRWHQPYTQGLTYTNGDLLVQDERLIMRNIGAAKSYGMGTLGYVPMYSVNSSAIQPNFLNDGSGAQLSWGMFLSNCGSSCQLSDIKGFGGANAATANIGLMDPTNTNWIAYWVNQVKLWRQKYGFDGIFIDTYGTLGGNYWSSSGQQINYSNMLSNFVKAASLGVGAPVILNPASPWLEGDLATGMEAYYFDERWDHPDDISTYDKFHSTARFIWNTANRSPHSIGLDWDMGMDKGLAQQSNCQSATGATCTFNLPGALYLEASAIATGAHHNWIVDGDRFISNDDYPIWGMLKTTPAFIQAEYDYQTFGVAYEKLLRDNINDNVAAQPSIVSGPSYSTTATSGNVWLIPTSRSGFSILHMVNFTALNSTQMGDVQDPNGNYPAPAATGPITVKFYTTGTLGNLYFASPDINHGKSQALSYTTGSDSSGTFITFTVPSLSYYDMVWLETNLASSDYSKP